MGAMIAALAFVRRIPSMLSPKGWLAVAVLAAFLLFGAYCAHGAAEGERDRQAAETRRAEGKASTGRETASAERLNDALSNNAAREELTDALDQLPDAVPSDRRVRLACERLRRQGTPADDLPERCRSGR
jgi:hypothetical protein